MTLQQQNSQFCITTAVNNTTGTTTIMHENGHQQQLIDHETEGFICSLCKVSHSDQFKFFEHLKTHYESVAPTISILSDYQAAEILLEASTSSNNHSHLNNRLIGNQRELRLVQVHQHEDEVGDEQLHLATQDDHHIDQDDSMIHHELKLQVEDIKTIVPSCSSNVDDVFCTIQHDNSTIDVKPAQGSENKVLLKCSKCKRTFRREKTYQTHVDTCQKIENDEDFDGGKVLKPKGRKAKLKPQEIVILQNDEVDIGSHDMVDESLEDETMEEENNVNVDQYALAYEEEDEEEEEDLLSDDNVCPVCDLILESRAKLEAHLKKTHPDLKIPPRPAATKGSKKKKAAAGQKKQEVLKCSECSRIFNHRNSLVYHMRSHTGERPHQCEMCGKSFFATSALKVHMRLHSGEKPYKCEHCGRHFRQWGDLKYHVISIHSDIRQYQCEFCGKDFARKYSLIVHRRIHTGERNYKCEFCGKCFRAASYLQNHRRIHTGEKPHACIICGKPFRVRSDMKRHMSSHNRDHVNQRYPASSTNSAAASTSVASTSSANQNEMENNATVVTVSNSTASQLIAVGPQISQHLVHHNGRVQTIEVPVSSSELLVGQQVQHVALDDSNEAIITGDISDGTPINITLSQDGRLAEGTTLSAATVATLQEADLPDGVIYQNRDGQMEVVTIRESTTGTLYVWPVYMN